MANLRSLRYPAFVFRWFVDPIDSDTQKTKGLVSTGRSFIHLARYLSHSKVPNHDTHDPVFVCPSNYEALSVNQVALQIFQNT